MKTDPFAKEQKETIKKALLRTVCPLKPKHARIIIMGTHQDKSCNLFWDTVSSIKLESNAVVTWKFYHLLHILIRDGHSSVIDDSQTHVERIVMLESYWNEIKKGTSDYGSINSQYYKVLIERLGFHAKYPQIPGNLTLQWKELRTIQRKPDESFVACTKILDLMDSLLALQREVFKSLEVHQWSYHGLQGQMLLAPLMLVLKDITRLYDISLQYMFHLHTIFPYQTLEGHRTRFQETYHETKNFYESVKKCKYFEHLATVSDLPEQLPNFIQSLDDSLFRYDGKVTAESKGGRSPSDGIDLLSTLQLHERSYRNDSTDSEARTPPSAPLLYDFVGDSQEGTLRATLRQHERSCCSDEIYSNPFSSSAIQSRGVYENL